MSSNHAVANFFFFFFLFIFFFILFFSNLVRPFMVTFLSWSTTNIYHSLDVHHYCTFYLHYLCKMACKATNEIYGVQRYKCNTDVYPTHIISKFLIKGIKITFQPVIKPMQ